MEVKEELNQLEEALESLRGEIKALKILRDGKYLATVYPEELEGWDIQEWLKKKFGGGKYTVQLIKKDGRFGKSFTFLIEGRPKEPVEEKVQDPAVAVLLEQIRELKEELRRREGGGEDLIRHLVELEKEQIKEYRELLLNLLKQEKKESSLLEKLLQNPQLLLTLGSGLWKLLEKALTKKDELIELIKVAKDDPELKGLIGDVLSAKYGASRGLLDTLLNNPELIQRFLSTLEGLLRKRSSNWSSNRLDDGHLKSSNESSNGNLKGNLTGEEGNLTESSNPMEVYLRLLQMLMEGKEARAIWNSLKDNERAYLREYIVQTGLETADELIGVLKASGLPREYIDLLKGKKAVVDELISIVKTEN